MKFEFKELDLKGVFVISSFFADDNRGGFTKYFEKDIFKNAGIDFELNETFSSKSRKNVIRGLHFQFDNPQAKLVSVIAGKVWDVVVDLRLNSSTFKQWIGVELSEENHLSFYVPRGFAHGFLSLSDNSVILYQCDGKYNEKTDTGIIFNDPDIKIDWPIDISEAICSQRDLALPTLKDFEYLNRLQDELEKSKLYNGL